eukprot:scaffold306756_cov16-Prasinocladus_malaysianus.AAC.1
MIIKEVKATKGRRGTGLHQWVGLWPLRPRRRRPWQQCPAVSPPCSSSRPPQSSPGNAPEGTAIDTSNACRALESPADGPKDAFSTTCGTTH